MGELGGDYFISTSPAPVALCRPKLMCGLVVEVEVMVMVMVIVVGDGDGDGDCCWGGGSVVLLLLSTKLGFTAKESFVENYFVKNVPKREKLSAAALQSM